MFSATCLVLWAIIGLALGYLFGPEVAYLWTALCIGMLGGLFTASGMIIHAMSYEGEEPYKQARHLLISAAVRRKIRRRFRRSL